MRGGRPHAMILATVAAAAATLGRVTGLAPTLRPEQAAREMHEPFLPRKLAKLKAQPSGRRGPYTPRKKHRCIKARRRWKVKP